MSDALILLWSLFVVLGKWFVWCGLVWGGFAFVQRVKRGLGWQDDDKRAVLMEQAFYVVLAVLLMVVLLLSYLWEDR